MKTSSAKGKGRRLQDTVRDAFRALGRQLGLQDDDFRSAIMGTSGVDLLLSPAAMKVIPVAIECKNHESISDLSTFIKHYQLYKDEPSLKLYFRSKNHLKGKIDDSAVVMLRLSDFFDLLRKAHGLTAPTD